MNTIIRYKMLTQQECLQVRSVVYALKYYWLKRNPYVLFYTLGAASYIDAAKDQQDYYRLAKFYNSILRDRIVWLYERLANTLAQLLKAPTTYQHSLAMPGFHIYLACKLFEQPLASIHTDLQYQLVNWEFPHETDLSNPISFTLGISLPKFGGGLNLWNLHHQEIMGISKSEFKQLIKSTAKSFYPYQLGEIILHDGHTFHQAALMKNIQPDDERITLQGHGIFSQGSWQLYW